MENTERHVRHSADAGRNFCVSRHRRIFNGKSSPIVAVPLFFPGFFLLYALLPPLLLTAIMSSNAVKDTANEAKAHNGREEKAKPGASWKANEEHVLPQNRMPLVSDKVQAPDLI
jgi:hypothetical protein